MTNFGFVCLHKFRNQIDATYFGGVFADFCGKEIYRAFDRCCGFGSTRATICDDWHRIGDNRSRAALHFLDVVNALRHWASHGRGEHSANVNPASRILNCIQLICSNAAGSSATNRDVLQLRPTVTQTDH